MNKKPSSTVKQSTLPKSVRVPQAPSVNKDASKKLRFMIDKATTHNGPTGLKHWIKACHIVQLGAWALSGLSGFAFVIVTLTPILVPLMTFGTCFSGGLGEWKEFSVTAIQMSLYPGALAAIGAIAAIGAKRMLENLTHRFENEVKQSHEMKILEDLIRPTA